MWLTHIDHPQSLAVEQEGPKQAAAGNCKKKQKNSSIHNHTHKTIIKLIIGNNNSPVEMIQYGDEKVFIELKRTRKLLQQLPNTVHELHENGWPLVVVMVTITMANTLMPREKIGYLLKNRYTLNLTNCCTCANLCPNDSHSFSMRTCGEESITNITQVHENSKKRLWSWPGPGIGGTLWPFEL